MRNETFYLDDVDVRDYGICLQRPVTVSGLVPIVEVTHIPGRNGDLIFDTGAYENRSGTADCFLLHDRVDLSIDAAARFLLSNHGYRKLQLSDDPNHYYMARITNGVDIEQRMRLLNPFSIKFDCMPQRWAVDGDEEIQISDLNVSTSVYNSHSGDAKPLIMTSSLVGATFQVNSLKLTVAMDEEADQSDLIYIDSEDKNVYLYKYVSGKLVIENANDRITLVEVIGGSERDTTTFPTLFSGENTVKLISGNGIFIKPRWWDK